MLAQIKNKKIFRINDWWKSKAALLMGMVYLYTAWFAIDFEKMISLSLLSISTIAGFASFGYLCNDFFDRGKDTITGKRNFLIGKSNGQIILLFLVAATILSVPWLYLPFNALSIFLFAFELLLFFFYSVKPFRFKERGLLGIITDALYAHAIPVLLSLYTFHLVAQLSLQILPIGILLLWQTTNGVRNILLHQHEDLDADKKSDVKNFVSELSQETFFTLIKYCMAVEIILSTAFFTLLSLGNFQFVFCVALIFFFAAMSFIIFFNPGLSIFLRTRWKYFPNPVYEKWLPVALLLGLSSQDISFLILVFAHITLFNFSFYREFFNHVLLPFIDWLKVRFIFCLITLRRIFSFIINYTIHLAFLAFGINLKQENLSALAYFRKHQQAKNNLQ